MDYNRAEIIAINSLSFVAESEKHLSGYLKLSGMSLDQLKNGATNQESMPNIMASVLDYLLQNEKCLINFSEDYNINPLEIKRARQFLPGAMPFQS